MCLSISVLLAVSSVNLYHYLNRKVQVLGVETSPLEEKVYWEQITVKNPTYRDAWIELAGVQAELGQKDLASSSLEVAKSIDPNSVKILETEREIFK